ncbi:3-hydroxyacyl-CoA dehydrogenase [Pseudolabrys sp. Root1462]|uniref:3-hydroxyacyl-CoA dehydrogenase NAD-binding domain-containing protein n=1 Tax=Pseudolabrys sp. Root1462 TaxID=1736466 RepID=UPI000703B2B9|nr:3-hydroxyacyl-CoA dehydrogenase NAD-binding domain-containing protein [Pseudolabrys sp. Root1462]KQY98263.1 3-hydroxyacyl-CoA dehydrogenase [Pseudolabrys sp. Root1462]
MSSFKLDIDTDGIALITWDMADRSMNVITMDVIAELSSLVDKVTNDPAIKGAVITSGKEAFCGGADLTMLESMGGIYADKVKKEGEEAAAKYVYEESSKLSQLYRRLEKSGKPWVCALNGTAMGGGFELALACHRRIAADNPKTRLGLPEIKVGLFPGAGGTQRVVRMMMPADALQFLLKGDQLKVDRAKAMKLIDEVVPQDKLIETAKAWIKGGGKGEAPWDVKGYKFPGGLVYSKAGMMTFPPANAIYRRETYDNYPAARAILQVVYEGLQLDIDTALRVESRWFAKILRSPEAAAMIRTLFVNMQDLNKGARRPANVPPTNIKKIGVVGAGFMGAGIAQVSAAAGLSVVLIDRDQETADKGKAGLHKALSDRVAKGRMKSAERDGLLEKIMPTADYAALKDCDLVVEAVFEDRKVKADVIKKIAAVIRDDATFASNTSTLPITSLAAEFKEPKRFIGIHFFSPVDRMMLVEVIMGKETGDPALAAALDFIRAIRKTPIVVNDTRGFYANRCVLNYIREGHLMLQEGIPAAMIENTARMAGMPVGPLSLNDETALDLGLKIVRATEADLGANAVDPGMKKLLEDLVEKHQRFGRKNGKGFYDYAPGQPKKLWPGLADLLPKKLTREQVEALDVEELKQRFLVVQAVEAARTFEEHVVTDVREADVGSILGFGFAPFTGGTLSYIDMMGTKAFVALCNKFVKKYGDRFTPPKLLVEMAEKGESFHTRFAPKKKAA